MSRDVHPLRSLPAVDDELVALIGRLCDGTASHEDCTRLDQCLADPAAVECYCAMLELEASLQWWWHTMPSGQDAMVLEMIAALAAPVQPRASAALPSPPSRDVRTAWSRLQACVAAAADLVGGIEIEPRRLSITVLAAVLTIGGLLAVSGGWGARLLGVADSPVGDSVRPADAIARIRAVDGVVWREPLASHVADEWLPEGARLDIVRGLIEVAYLTGATVIIEGPASFEVSGAGTGTLARGRLTATLNKPRTSFAIHTPSAIVTDRGTQFGVEVDEQGATDVRVFQGLVELAAVGMIGADSVLQLAAGHAGEVDARGQTARVAAPAPKKFVTAVTATASRRGDSLPYAWDDAAAITLYRDSFDDARRTPSSEPLQGSAPVARGGVGNATWIAASDGWQVDPARGGLTVTAAGAAFLPFRPEPGFVYRLSVEMHVHSGGSGWAAMGFAEGTAIREPALDHAWMLQRHSTTLSAHRAARNPNAAFAGPGEEGRLPGGDELTGPQVRTVVLDTTRPQWRAFFLAGETVMGDCPIGGRGRDIKHVGLSVFTDTTATLRNFSLQAFRPAIR